MALRNCTPKASAVLGGKAFLNTMAAKKTTATVANSTTMCSQADQPTVAGARTPRRLRHCIEATTRPIPDAAVTMEVHPCDGRAYKDAMSAAHATVISACHHGADAARAATPARSPTLFGVFVMVNSLRVGGGYVMVTSSCWVLVSNPTPGSELTNVTNCPGPADIPRPCTTMDVVRSEEHT